MNGSGWLVIGSTGRVGRAVVNELLHRCEKVRVLVRDPQRANEFGPDVERVRGDLADPASVVAAMRGMNGVFFVTPHVPDDARLGLNVIDAAEKVGLSRMV